MKEVTVKWKQQTSTWIWRVSRLETGVLELRRWHQNICILEELNLIYWGEGHVSKRSSLKNWKGRDEEEDPGKDGEKKWKEIFKCWEWEDGESWWYIGTNGEVLFDRPKPTAGCSANGSRRGARLIVLATFNIWVVLPKDHNADNKHRIHDYTFSL